MTAEDMAASNKDVVAQISHAGKKAGAEAERKRLTDLQAAFPNDAAFVAEATTEGWSVTEAKAAKFDAVSAENKELKTKNAELEKATKEPAIEFAPSDSEAKGTGADEGTVDEKDAKSVEIWNKNAKIRTAFNGNKNAFQAVYRNDPDEALSFGK